MYLLSYVTLATDKKYSGDVQSTAADHSYNLDDNQSTFSAKSLSVTLNVQLYFLPCRGIELGIHVVYRPLNLAPSQHLPWAAPSVGAGPLMLGACASVHHIT